LDHSPNAAEPFESHAASTPRQRRRTKTIGPSGQGRSSRWKCRPTPHVGEKPARDQPLTERADPLRDKPPMEESATSRAAEHLTEATAGGPPVHTANRPRPVSGMPFRLFVDGSAPDR